MAELKDMRESIDLIDGQIRELFLKRMEVVNEIGKYKKAKGIPIEDLEREKQIIDNKSAFIKNETLKNLYIDLLKCIFKISKNYQNIME